MKALENLLWLSYPISFAISFILFCVSINNPDVIFILCSFICDAIEVPYTALKTDFNVVVLIRYLRAISSIVIRWLYYSKGICEYCEQFQPVQIDIQTICFPYQWIIYLDTVRALTLLFASMQVEILLADDRMMKR